MSNKPNLKQRPAKKPAAPPKEPKAIESPLVWLIGIVLVVGAAAVIFLALSVSDDATDSSSAVAETAFAEILGPPLPPFSNPDAAIGMEVPVISAQTFEGERVQIGDDGMARLYGFFAHWCPHCQDELPRVTDWLGSNDLPDGVEIVAISTGVDQGAPNYPPSEWFEEEEWPELVVVDDDMGTIASGFGLTGFPYWVAANADGSVAVRVSGELTEEQFELLVASVVPGEAAAGPSQPATSSAGIRTVSADEAADIYSNPPDDMVVLDVRTPAEFEEGHLEGAILVDFYDADFVEQLADLDPDQPYLLYCRSGNRSGETIGVMQQLGFADVANVDGGILAWEQAGHPTVK